MDAAVLTVLALLAGAMALFISGRLRVDLVALCLLAALLLTRLIRPEQALYGFASPATATVAAMFVLSAGLVRTGVVQWLSRRIDRLAGSGEARLVVVLCVTIAVLSAFVVNTATVAILIPVAIVLAARRKVSPSRVLIPLSFASQFGGVCTLIGTSTNILVNAIVIERGLRPFGIFEFAPLGLLMTVAGVLYLVLIGRRILPVRRGEMERVDKYRLSDYLAEFRVRENSPLIDKPWPRPRAGSEPPIELFKVMRDERAIWRPGRTALAAGDVLLLHGNLKRMMELQEEQGLELVAEAALSDAQLSSDEVRLVELLVPPRSRLRGRTLRTAGFARRFGGDVLALQRRARLVRERVADVALQAGDTLLVQADQEDIARMIASSDVILTNELTELQVRRERALVALGWLVAVVGLAALHVVPILVAALFGAVGMVLTRCLSLEEAYEAIDWKVVFLLGGILPLGLALEQSGAAAWLAETLLAPLAGAGPLAVLAALYLTTALMTETMSNNAAAVILAPIALSLAGGMGVDPRPFLVAIAFAASTSFATPVGYQTNTMVYAPGGYRFADYTRVGGPLNLIFWALAVLFIPVLWPF